MFVTIPTAVELLLWMGVGGCRCGYPNSFKVSLITFASFVFKKRVPSSASEADAATSHRIVLIMWIVQLRQVGLLSWGMLPRKYYPAVQL